MRGALSAEMPRAIGAAWVTGALAVACSFAVSSRAVADEPCVTMTLSAAGRRVLEATEPGLCLALYRYVIFER